MGRIITLTGRSGTGKTTIVKELLELKDPLFQLIISYTTRDPRPSDLPGEYRYLTDDEFEGMKKRGEFLWPKSAEEFGHSSAKYGTTKASLDDAVASPGYHLMMLIPQALPKLWDSYAEHVVPFWLEDPGEESLRARLLDRGEKPQFIDKRLDAEKDWLNFATASGIPYVSVPNVDGKLDVMVNGLLRYLGSS